jgi:hypothetical protein
MSSLSYTQQAIEATPLLDEEQWQSLLQELSPELLYECAQELLQEIHEEWLLHAEKLSGVDLATLCSMAHKSAGAAGTMAFARLRHVFLCLEHSGLAAETQGYLACLATVWQDTRAMLVVGF